MENREQTLSLCLLHKLALIGQFQIWGKQKIALWRVLPLTTGKALYLLKRDNKAAR